MLAHLEDYPRREERPFLRNPRRVVSIALQRCRSTGFGPGHLEFLRSRPYICTRSSRLRKYLRNDHRSIRRCVVEGKLTVTSVQRAFLYTLTRQPG